MGEAKKLYGVFGAPPRDLVVPPGNARQLSPLFPGAAPLAALDAGSLAGLTMLAPPGTIERRRALALALRALAPAGELIALAPKDKGGSRIAKELKTFGCEVQESVKHHYRICSCRKPEALSGLDAAIAEGAMRFDDDLGLYTQPGLFSWNSIDPGSNLLLEVLPPLAGVGADFGCGYGLLARKILTSAKVERLTLVDLDGRAVEASRHNVSDPRANFLWADVRHGNPALRDLDFVVMNPPFHDGGTEDRKLGAAFIERAAASLRPGGMCWLVANRHLPYEAVIATLFETVKLVVDAKGFKVYTAQKALKSQATPSKRGKDKPPKRDKPPREERRAKRYDPNADTGDFDLEAFMREQNAREPTSAKPSKGKGKR